MIYIFYNIQFSNYLSNFEKQINYYEYCFTYYLFVKSFANKFYNHHESIFMINMKVVSP